MAGRARSGGGDRRVAVLPDCLRERLECGLAPAAVGRAFDAELHETPEDRSGGLQRDDGTGKILEWQRDRVERAIARPIPQRARLWRRRSQLEVQRQSLVAPFEEVRNLRVVGVHDADVGEAARRAPVNARAPPRRAAASRARIPRRERTLIAESRRIEWRARRSHAPAALLGVAGADASDAASITSQATRHRHASTPLSLFARSSAAKSSHRSRRSGDQETFSWKPKYLLTS